VLFATAGFDMGVGGVDRISSGIKVLLEELQKGKK
jgi:hypothetical protein